MSDSLSVVSLLLPFLLKAERDLFCDTPSSRIGGQACTHVLASVTPYLVRLDLTQNSIRTRLVTLLTRVVAEHQSVYDASGVCAVFHVRMAAEGEPEVFHHPSAMAWDSYYDAAKVR